MGVGVAHRLERPRRRLATLAGDGRFPAGLGSLTLERVDVAVTVVVDAWRPRPAGTVPGPDAPAWARVWSLQVIARHVDDATLDLVDVAALLIGDLLVGHGHGIAWDMGRTHGINEGDVVVVDQWGGEFDPVGELFRAAYAQRAVRQRQSVAPGIPAMSLGGRVGAWLELADRSPEDVLRTSLDDADRWNTVLVRRPYNRLRRRRELMATPAVAAALADLLREPVDLAADPVGWIHRVSYPRCWWVAAVRVHPFPGGIGAVEIAILGTPRDADGHGSDELGWFLRSMHALADRLGAVVDEL